MITYRGVALKVIRDFKINLKLKVLLLTIQTTCPFIVTGAIFPYPIVVIAVTANSIEPGKFHFG